MTMLCIVLLFSLYSINTLQYSFSQHGMDSFWTRGADMPRLTTEATATALDDGIYVIGGYDEEGEGVGMVEMYNTTTNIWANDIAQLPLPIHHTSAASYDGKVYVAGGYVGDWTATDGLFIYDPQTNEWTQANPMPTPRGYPTADIVNGKLYVLGGDGGAARPSAAGGASLRAHHDRALPDADAHAEFADPPAGGPHVADPWHYRIARRGGDRVGRLRPRLYPPDRRRLYHLGRRSGQ